MDNQIKALKVKIKSLAEESRIIRLEERRALCSGHSDEVRRKYRDVPLFLSLRNHRTEDVRIEQRHALLAYAFLRGKVYAECEPKASKPIEMSRLRALIEKFGGRPGLKMACELATIQAWMASKPVAATV